jgi:hypothetical protein
MIKTADGKGYTIRVRGGIYDPFYKVELESRFQTQLGGIH